ncbi:hypothetical protein [Aquibium sp. ELW1220]|uniref:hypothetical protein n=1 Tax=Aquibium sp. ELW1220 TaxID=2976766 RepID=UPI0025B0B2D5|nr:hypothetical protein [Aquibium sp. ELW1220]MDN2580240.1 hypothetical protein [Aquibium sp. ELW1220]
MFEIGSEYKVITLETGDNYEGKWSTYESERVYEVAAVDGNLVKFLGPDFSKHEFEELLATSVERNMPREEIILNTSSLFFVRAEKIANMKS